MASSKKLPASKDSKSTHDFLLESVKQQLVTLLKSNGLVKPHLLVAYSGGLDSTVLLHVLFKLTSSIPMRLEAMHVHHGLSENADSWAVSCESFCAELNIPLNVFKVNLDLQTGLGLEAEARKARYDALATAKADLVCLGHHQDDQAETLLLQLARGAGVKGLAAMGGADLQRHLFRPLLNMTRGELLNYAEHNQLTWVDDESNQDTQFDRNFIRHQLLPLLNQQFPSIHQRLARTASHMAEASELLSDLAEIDASQVLDESKQYGALKLSELDRLSDVRKKNLIRYWLNKNHLLAPSANVLMQICKQLASTRPDANMKVKVADARFVMRYQGCAYLVNEPKHRENYQLAWQGEEVIVLPDLSRLFFKKVMGEGIDISKIHSLSPLIIRRRKGGEKIKPDASRPTRTLKQLMQNSHIPPWQRQQLPLVYSENRLVAVPDVAVDAALIAPKNQIGLCISWQPNTTD